MVRTFVAFLLTGQSLSLMPLLDAAHKNEIAKRTDEFASFRDPEVADGSKFTVRLQAHSGDASGKEAATSAYYTYEDGRLRIVLSLSEDGFAKERLLKFKSLIIKGRTFTGANAFGVRSNVTAFTQRVDALAVSAMPFGNFFDSDSEKLYKEQVQFYRRIKTEMPKPYTNYYIYEAMLDGPTAKAAVQNYEIVIEGRLKREKGSLVGCRSSLIEATLRNPEEVLQRTCWVRSVIDSVSYIDRRTAKNLASWSRSSSEE